MDQACGANSARSVRPGCNCASTGDAIVNSPFSVAVRFRDSGIPSSRWPSSEAYSAFLRFKSSVLSVPLLSCHKKPQEASQKKVVVNAAASVLGHSCMSAFAIRFCDIQDAVGFPSFQNMLGLERFLPSIPSVHLGGTCF